MTYLFQQPIAVQVTVAYRDSSEDVVHLPRDLWDTLLPYCEPHNGRIALTISRVSTKSAATSEDLICWCENSVSQTEARDSVI